MAKKKWSFPPMSKFALTQDELAMLAHQDLLNAACAAHKFNHEHMNLVIGSDEDETSNLVVFSFSMSTDEAASAMAEHLIDQGEIYTALRRSIESKLGLAARSGGIIN